MSIDRDATLKRAETLLRQGKLDGAIAEYVRLVEDQPRDWNSINALGDLYLRAGDTSKAAAQFTRIADHLFHEGFLAKAAALYKKALKARGDDEHSQLQLFDIAAKQGLLADAKMYLRQLSAQRTQRGDERGATECLVLLGTLDEDDADSKLLAARAARGLGDTRRAAELLREAARAFEKQQRRREGLSALIELFELEPGDPALRLQLAREHVAAGQGAAVRRFVSPETAADDPDLLLALLEADLIKGRLGQARAALSRLLTVAPERSDRALAIATDLAGRGLVDPAYAAVQVVVDAALLQGSLEEAAATLRSFVRAAPHVPALMRLVEVCVDGGMDATLRAAQAQLVDVYLAEGRAAEARVIAEDLVRRAGDGDGDADLARLRRALEMLGVERPDEEIAALVSGGTAEDAVDDLLDLSDAALAEERDGVAPTATPPVAAGPVEVDDTEAGAVGVGSVEVAAGPVVEDGEATRAMLLELEALESDQGEPEIFEIDLSEALASLAASNIALPTVTVPVTPDLDAVFQDLRVRGGGDDVPPDAEYRRAMSEIQEGRRADGLARLYERADQLQASGETARALALLMELESLDGAYRDVATRIAALIRSGTGSAGE